MTRMRFVIVLITLLAFQLRIYRVGYQSLWLDEAISVNLSQASLAGAIDLAVGDIHPPLYYVLLHFWMFLLGSSEVMVRLLSVAFNVLSLVVLYRVATVLFEDSVGIVAALLLTWSPFQIRYAQEARQYALLGLVVLLSTYFCVVFLQSGKVRYLLSYAIVTSLSFYVHYQAFFFPLIHTMFVVVFNRRCAGIVKKWFAGQALAVIFFLPWVPIFFEQIARGGRYWMPFSGHPGVMLKTLIVFGTGETLPLWLFICLVGPTCLLLGLSLYLLMTRSQARTVFLLVASLVLPVVGSFLLSFKSNVYGYKYLIGVSFAYYVLLSAAVTSPNIPKVWRRVLGVVLTAILVAPAIVSLGNYYFVQSYQREGWRDAVRYLELNRQPRDAAAFHFRAPMEPFNYYSTGLVPAFGLVQGTAEPSNVADAVRKITTDYDRIWLFDYLKDVYDPHDFVNQSLERQGFRLSQTRNIDGIVLLLYTQGEKLE